MPTLQKGFATILILPIVAVFVIVGVASLELFKQPHKDMTFVKPKAIADTIFINGEVITMEEDFSPKEAIAIKGGEILAVGSSADIQTLKGEETKIIDLKGKTLLPGFVDSHTHLLNDAQQYLGLTIEQAQEKGLRDGITTLANMFVDQRFLQTMKQMEENGRLKIRTNLYLLYNDNCGRPQNDWYLNHQPSKDPNKMLRILGIKIYSDGGSCLSGAYSFNLPSWYVRKDPKGDLFLTAEEITSVIQAAQDKGYQVAIHAEGDRAVETVLKAAEKALAGRQNSQRLRIEHNGFIRPELMTKYGELGIVASVWGPMACYVLDLGKVGTNGEHDHFFGPIANSWHNPVRTLLEKNPGLHVAWQSDLPWAGQGPIADLYAYVTRNELRKNGSVCKAPSWLKNEAISVEQALRMMTIESAYALFMEEKIGSLKPGKFADLAVLSDNPLKVDPTFLKDLQILVTMIGGKAEYCSQEFQNLCK